MSVSPYTGERTRLNVHGKPYAYPLAPATVYSLFTAEGDALYVGCTMRPGPRLAEHGGKPWWTDVASIHVEHFEDVSDARRRERELIAEFLPRHNVAGMPAAELARRASPDPSKAEAA